MVRRSRRRGVAWSVTVRPVGTEDEAAVAARQARRLVAGWIDRDLAAQDRAAAREGS